MSENPDGTQSVKHVEKTESTEVVAAPVTTDASQAKDAVAVESEED